MNTIRLIPLLMAGVLVGLAPSFAESENAHCAEKDSGLSDKKLPKDMHKFYYDLLSDCGFSLSSDRAFIRDKKICSLLSRDKAGSPFFYGTVSSNKEYLDEKSVLGAIRLSEKSPKSTRIDYYDAQRDVTQHQVRSRQILALTDNKKDIVIVTELEVVYDRLDRSGQILTSVKEKYECWDGVFYGKITAVSVALCGLGSTKENHFASQSSWQAEVIKSLCVE